MKKLGFGLMRLPLLDSEDQRSVDREQTCRMIDTFIKEGFTYFDTAYMYHKYTSENIVKECLVERHPRESFVLASKLPAMFVKEAADLEKYSREQLEKCGVDYFDYYLLHALCDDYYSTIEEVGGFEYMMKLKREGKARHIGFSFHDTAEMLDKILTEHPEMEFVQLQYNYLDLENPKVQSRACLEVAKDHNVPVIIMEPVKGGALANVSDEVKELFENTTPGASAASFALRFAAQSEGVFMVLSGMSDMAQLCDNISIMKEPLPLTKEEEAAVETAGKMISGKITIPCTSCRYCVEDCPVSISIPEYFDLYNRKKAGESVEAEYKAFEESHAPTTNCIECRMCESLCPQHLEISRLLKTVNDELSK